MTTDILENTTVFRTERVKDLLAELDALTFENTIEGHRLSIYLPAGRMPEDAEQARIYFRNSIDTLQKRLSEDGGRSTEIQTFLRSLDEFASGQESDKRFWNHQLGGMAIFGDARGIRLMEVRKKFKPAMYFSSHWHLTPLLELGANVDAYWLLSISQNQVQLYRGSRLGIRRIHLPNVPHSIAETESLGIRTTGLGAEDETTGVDRQKLRHFFDEVDAEVAGFLGDDTAPLLLAGVDYYLPIYQEVCRYPHLSDKMISGNPEHLPNEKLHARASEILRSEFKQSRKRELLKIRDKMECDLVATKIGDVLKAAEDGRIAALVAPSNRVCWGRFDPETRTVETLPETDIRGRDLYQEAAEKTLLHGGRLFYLKSRKMPKGKPICAELRY